MQLFRQMPATFHGQFPANGSQKQPGAANNNNNNMETGYQNNNQQGPFPQPSHHSHPHPHDNNRVAQPGNEVEKNQAFVESKPVINAFSLKQLVPWYFTLKWGLAAMYLPIRGYCPLATLLLLH